MALNLSKLAAALGPRVETAVGFMLPDEISAEDRAAMDEYASYGVPFVVGDAALKQSTGQTCGAMAVLASLVLTYPGLRASIEHDPGSVAFLEQEIYEDLRAGALGPVSWPASLGTPPWTLARELSDGVIDYRHVPVDDASNSGFNALQWAYHATTQGHTVPLYTGGSVTVPSATSRGAVSRRIAAAVPRHVVLAIPGEQVTDDGIPQLTIFDPASGKIYPVPLPALVKRDRPMPALGHWTHVVWAVLPYPAGE